MYQLLEFFGYFIVAVMYWSVLWWFLKKAMDRIEEWQQRKFTDRVDRYRRGRR